MEKNGLRKNGNHRPKLVLLLNLPTGFILDVKSCLSNAIHVKWIKLCHFFNGAEKYLSIEESKMFMIFP